MTFIYPLGLLGLIGVPIVVLIYILKNKYNEQTVPSTYLWTLSEKFFKRRNPLSGLTGLISLILQILTIIFVSLAIARPVFIIPESASDYCFILDCSGSMNMTLDGKSRFELAKEEISEIIDDASQGSTYTLIKASTNSGTVFDGIKDKKLALELLNETESTDGTIDSGEALAIAQEKFNENTSLVTYFFTDKSYTEHKNIEIANFGLQNVENYSVNNLSGSFMNGVLSVSCDVISHISDAELELELYVNGSDAPAATLSVSAEAGKTTEAKLDCLVTSYDSYKVVIKNQDSFMTDNEFVIYNQKSESSYDILLVSEKPFFFEAALDVLTDSTVDVVDPDDYVGQGGYGLYIFDSYTPDTLPDAAVWLINSPKSVADSGFSIRAVTELDAPGELVKSTSTSSVVRGLLQGIGGRNIFISEYIKYGAMYTKFTTLFYYDSNPVIFAGTNALGNREVVVGFDLHKADFSLSTDFVPLFDSLLTYSCPDVLDKTGYESGEDVNINITANVINVKAVSPGGEEIYVDTSTDMGTLRLDRVGTYVIKVLTSDGDREYKLYSGAPIEESTPTSTEASFSLVGEQEFLKTDGEYDPLVILFVCLAVIFMADWMVYCYEKYQLR